ncbi:hypothetical protein QTO34_015546 [Cnephaeus nilssonii]|uniref:Intercellular adhesion molecule 1 n=1 Tax=Cnephaeus nilssonii TaxID=3371016 RepID=A0AA40LRA6_CNENI|nr:hypothetical protein QTO34_015546 [Eptesicus nilssonii]
MLPVAARSPLPALLACSGLCSQGNSKPGLPKDQRLRSWGPRNIDEPNLQCLSPLHTFVPGPGGAQTSVDPKEVTIPRGGSVLVNCSTSCDQHTLLGLETHLNKKEVARGSNWETYELSNIQEDTTPFCYSTCHNNQTKATMSLAVYWFPERVELAPLPHWQPVGENLTLHCQVEGGAPRTHLSVMLLQGEKLLSRQPAVGTPVAEVRPQCWHAETTMAPISLAAQNWTFGPKGWDYSRTAQPPDSSEPSMAKPQSLRGGGVPGDRMKMLQERASVPPVHTLLLLASPAKAPPHLGTPRILEVGTQGSVNCALDGLFPVSEAQVHLALEDQRLKPTIKYSKDSLLATAMVEGTPGEEGIHPLTCAVTLGNQSRRTRENVTIYSFPAPNLTLSESEVPEETEVSVECKAHAGAVVTLSWDKAGSLLSSPQTKLNATAEDNGRVFLCSAALVVAGKVLHKNETQTLSVLYGPRLNKDTCPGNWTWEEGTLQNLSCQALGNPIPKLDCHRKGDGALLPIGDLRPVTRDIAGTYVCQATSSRGAVTREVVVNVIYHQSNLVTIIAVAALILGIASTVGLAAYLYNRQRKIRKYKLQKAQEEAAMKLNSPP